MNLFPVGGHLCQQFYRPCCSLSLCSTCRPAPSAHGRLTNGWYGWSMKRRRSTQRAFYTVAAPANTEHRLKTRERALLVGFTIMAVQFDTRGLMADLDDGASWLETKRRGGMMHALRGWFRRRNASISPPPCKLSRASQTSKSARTSRQSDTRWDSQDGDTTTTWRQRGLRHRQHQNPIQRDDAMMSEPFATSIKTLTRIPSDLHFSAREFAIHADVRGEDDETNDHHVEKETRGRGRSRSCSWIDDRLVEDGHLPHPSVSRTPVNSMSCTLPSVRCSFHCACLRRLTCRFWSS